MERLAGANDVDDILRIKSAARLQYYNFGIPLPKNEEDARRRITAHIAGGATWVWVAEENVVAYLVLVRLTDSLHIEQVTVHPSHAGRRIGAQLIDFAAEQAREHGVDRLTLTTFAEVPWNAPYYSRLGFQIIPDDQLPRELHTTLTEERRTDRTGWARVAMRRQIIDANSSNAIVS